VIVVISLGVILVALFAWAISYDLYWRRRGFRTEVKGWGRGMTHERVAIKQENDDEPA
jgi:hypothetical protein